jgi:hypothetical protein
MIEPSQSPEISFSQGIAVISPQKSSTNAAPLHRNTPVKRNVVFCVIVPIAVVNNVNVSIRKKYGSEADCGNVRFHHPGGFPHGAAVCVFPDAGWRAGFHSRVVVAQKVAQKNAVAGKLRINNQGGVDLPPTERAVHISPPDEVSLARAVTIAIMIHPGG